MNRKLATAIAAAALVTGGVLVTTLQSPKEAGVQKNAKMVPHKPWTEMIAEAKARAATNQFANLPPVHIGPTSFIASVTAPNLFDNTRLILESETALNKSWSTVANRGRNFTMSFPTIYQVQAFRAVSRWSATVPFTWSASQDPSVTQYRLYHGRAPGNYTNSVTTTSLAASLNNLPAGTNYVAATALNSGGAESDFSNEVKVRVSYATPSRPILTWSAQ